jgi:mannose-6-phosphate isomerase-like protein (cupin superfamily)
MKYFYDKFETSYNYQYMLDTHSGSVKNEILLDMPPCKDFRVNLAYFPPGTSANPHTHEWDHCMYIMKGKGKMVVAEEEGIIKKGMLIFIPRDAVHSVENIGKGNGGLECISGPPKTEAGFTQLKRK